MVNYKERKFKLGMHTYTLHLNGCGQNWGFVGDTFEQKINIFQLMDLANEWGLDTATASYRKAGGASGKDQKSSRRARTLHGIQLLPG